MKTQFPIIRSARLLLRQFTEHDLENVFRGLSHPDIIRYYGVQYNSLEATREQMKFFADLELNETGIWWAICSADNHRFYGAIGLNNLSKTHKKAEIGFWLMPECWGKGMLLEAMPLICEHAFDTMGLHRLEGFVETENMNCQKVMAKLNFRLEGTMQDCEIKDGRYISLHIYAKLNAGAR